MASEKAFGPFEAIRAFFSLLVLLLPSASALADSGQQTAQLPAGPKPSKPFGLESRDCSKNPYDALCPGPSPTVAGILVPRTWPPDDALGDSPRPATELYRHLVKSILYVEAIGQGSVVQSSSGSAVAIANNVAITNCHVVRQNGGFGAAWPVIRVSGREKSLYNPLPANAEIVEAHPEIDICVIKLDFSMVSPISTISYFGDLQVGETVYTLGNPEGLTFSWAAGTISALRPEAVFGPGKRANVIQFTAQISHGSSGGALFDQYGRLIGITSAFKAGDSPQNLNFAVAAGEVWRKFGKCPKPGQTVTEEYRCSPKW